MGTFLLINQGTKCWAHGGADCSGQTRVIVCESQWEKGAPQKMLKQIWTARVCDPAVPCVMGSQLSRSAPRTERLRADYRGSLHTLVLDCSSSLKANNTCWKAGEGLFVRYLLAPWESIFITERNKVYFMVGSHATNTFFLDDNHTIFVKTLYFLIICV